MLQEFDLEIRDKKGSKNVVAYHLSRLVQENPEEEDELPLREFSGRATFGGARNGAVVYRHGQLFGEWHNSKRVELTSKEEICVKSKEVLLG